ncbi:cytochrome P450 monooxygenase [Delitschia confertaspora ATCC 74209]|uniref:Cytochrome P450 monooxygenase n=1 Tax=Delitschia confertaspora ATCC 74209 TaxID=1513339 RepID=A0A9P4JFS4_9PLEO|nr:cytochrome P450 monooxygenase [Delitschia confertaspora ATCC 74209]
MAFLSFSIVQFALLGVIIVVASWRYIAAFVNKSISIILNAYLHRRHAWPNVEDGSKFPSARYEWPNGQGNKAKFIEGHKNSEIWEAEYGPLYRIWSGTTPEVVVTKPEHVRAIFKDSDRHLKGDSMDSGYVMGQLLGQCVGLKSQDHWKRVRAIMDVPFHKSMAANYIPIVKRRTTAWFQELWETRNLSRGLLDPAEDMKLLPFLIVAEVIYGELAPDVEAELRSLAPLREGLMVHVVNGGLARFAWAKHFPTAANRELNEYKKRWVAFNELAYQRAVEKGGSAPICDIFAAREAGQITTEEFLHTVDEMLMANLDVTVGAVSWNIVFMAAYPEYQDRIRAEIKNARAKYDEMGVEFDSYLLDESTLLAACVNESSRLRPVAPFSVPQAIPTARVVGGYNFPAGTDFVIDSYALNIRNPYWGENRHMYYPERFMEKGMTEARYSYWRFGFGPRKCLGRYVADVLLKHILVNLLDLYEVKMTKSAAMEEWQRNPEVWINHPVMELACNRRVSD